MANDNIISAAQGQGKVSVLPVYLQRTSIILRAQFKQGLHSIEGVMHYYLCLCREERFTVHYTESVPPYILLQKMWNHWYDKGSLSTLLYQV